MEVVGKDSLIRVARKNLHWHVEALEEVDVRLPSPSRLEEFKRRTLEARRCHQLRLLRMAG
ncbi:MAG: hypothetical protein ACRD2L_04320 [Terriglobia bacterium]